MAKTSVQDTAKIYAKAYASAVVAQQCLPSAQQDLNNLSQQLHEPVFAQFVGNPLYPAPAQLRILTAISQNLALSTLTLDTLKVLVHQKRLNLLPHFIQEAQNLIRAALNICPVSLLSAKALSQEDQQALQKKLEQALGQDVELHIALDPDLVAGSKIYLAPFEVDTSIRAQLFKIKNSLKAVSL